MRSWGGGGMLDESEHPGRHEPGRAHRRATTGNLGDLDDAATVGDLHPSTVAGGLDLVGPGGATGVDDDLSAVTLHGLPSLRVPRDEGPGRADGRLSANGTPRLQPNDRPRWPITEDPGDTSTRPGHPLQP